jgi:hypothetical protein
LREQRRPARGGVGHEFIASGRMRENRIRMLAGDKVLVEMTSRPGQGSHLSVQVEVMPFIPSPPGRGDDNRL